MKFFSTYSENIYKELACLKKELNKKIETTGKSDNNFKKVNTFGKRPIVCWTYQCNTLCPGCYAQRVKYDFSEQVMSTHEFGRILDLFQQTIFNFRGVTLLGGEPTLPKNFSDLLHELEKRKLFASIYTNGIKIRNNTDNVFDKIIKSPSIDQIVIHFQISHIRDSVYLQRMKDLKKNKKVVIARYDFPWVTRKREIDIILKKIALLKIPLSWSFTHPYDLIDNTKSCDYTRQSEFEILSDKIHYFFEKAFKLGVELKMGIPVPLCVFKKGDIEEYQKRWELKFDCIGVGDVHPDGRMCQCTVAPQISTIKKIKTPKQLATVIHFFQKHHRELREKFTSFPQCLGCKVSNPKRYASCSGGCTAYRLYGDRYSVKRN